jgi:molybdenum cofactor biosynthesis protein A
MRRLTDSYNRTHDYLRISLTDKCNLNCLYCNPSDKNRRLIPRGSYLSNEELLRLITLFVSEFGFRKIRFTGGEPLVRKDIFKLLLSVNELKKVYRFETGITTNGTLLDRHLIRLKEFGVDKLNISLDTLDKNKFKLITGRDNYYSVMEAIVKAKSLNFRSLKLNVVIIKGINEDEILDFVNFASEYELNVRFIEFMPFGNNLWNEHGFVSSDEMLQIVKNKFELDEVTDGKGGVARNFSIRNTNGTVGFISSISNHFCSDCNRLRITADGKLKLCLFSTGNDDLNLKEIFSVDSFTDRDISTIIENSLKYKSLKHPEIEELLRLEENNMLSIGG